MRVRERQSSTCTAKNSHGLLSYGLYSYGLYGYGLHGYGLLQ